MEAEKAYKQRISAHSLLGGHSERTGLGHVKAYQGSVDT